MGRTNDVDRVIMWVKDTFGLHNVEADGMTIVLAIFAVVTGFSIVLSIFTFVWNSDEVRANGSRMLKTLVLFGVFGLVGSVVWGLWAAVVKFHFLTWTELGMLFMVSVLVCSLVYVSQHWSVVVALARAHKKSLLGAAGSVSFTAFAALSPWFFGDNVYARLGYALIFIGASLVCLSMKGLISTRSSQVAADGSGDFASGGGPCWQELNAGEETLGRLSATAVFDDTSGDIIVFGGAKAGRVYNETWRYSVAKRSWKYAEIPGPNPSPRLGHSAVLVGHNMYMFGGGDGKQLFNDLWAFDTVKSVWQEVKGEGVGPSGRTGHGMTRVGKTLVLVGGCGAGKAYSSDVFYFDTAKSKWKSPKVKGKPPVGRLGHCVGAINRKIIVFGGSVFGVALPDLHTFDTETNEWKQHVPHQNCPFPRFGHTMCRIPHSSRFVVYGGQTGQGGAEMVYLLDGDTLAWTRLKVSNMPSNRSRHVAVMVSPTQLYVMTGGATEGQGNVLSDIWLFDLLGKKASQKEKPAKKEDSFKKADDAKKLH